MVSFFMKNTSYLYNRTRTREKICGIERNILILQRFFSLYNNNFIVLV